jgi:hypothetical protein
MQRRLSSRHFPVAHGTPTGPLVLADFKDQVVLASPTSAQLGLDHGAFGRDMQRVHFWSRSPHSSG